MAKRRINQELVDFKLEHPKVKLKFLGADEVGMYYHIANEDNGKQFKLYFTDKDPADKLDSRLLLAYKAVL